MDAKEERKKRDRERYARMTSEKKQEKLKKRREAYHQMKTKESEQRTKRCTEEEKEKMLEKRREAYQQKKTKEPDKRIKRCAQDRQRYANMHPDKKKAKIEQVKANRELKRITPCKESIAMLNPAYIPTEQEVLLEKRREAYHQKKIKEQKQRIKRYAQDRQRYINMSSKKKHS
jgi:hypothetical protein